MTSAEAKDYQRKHYLANRDKYLARSKKWRASNLEKSRASNRLSKKNSTRAKTEREIESERNSKKRYKERQKMQPRKMATPHQKEIARQSNIRYRLKQKIAKALLPVAPRKESKPREKRIFTQEELVIRRQRESARSKAWAAKNKDRVNAMRREKMKANPSFRVAATFRSRLSALVANGLAIKSKSIMKLLGCSIGEFLNHLELLFLQGMSWDNYGKNGWEIDHVIPCAHFDLTLEDHQKRCFHFSNHQPLWACDNRSKGDRLPTNAAGSRDGEGCFEKPRPRAKVLEFIRILE